jgi:hypothetical protein
MEYERQPGDMMEFAVWLAQYKAVIVRQRKLLKSFAISHGLERRVRGIRPYRGGQDSFYRTSYANMAEAGAYSSIIEMQGTLIYWNVHNQQWASCPCWGSGEALAEEYGEKLLEAGLIRKAPGSNQEHDNPCDWFHRQPDDYLLPISA